MSQAMPQIIRAIAGGDNNTNGDGIGKWNKFSNRGDRFCRLSEVLGNGLL